MKNIIDQLPNFVLCFGVDGSGKSTMLSSLERAMGYDVLEPTSTDEAKKFKRQSLLAPVTSDLVLARRHIYLNLNEAYEADIANRVNNGQRIAATGGTLVTQLSHDVMLEVIDEKQPNSRHGQIENWLNGTQVLPAVIIFTYAPFETIMKRIVERQQNGDECEKFWGFNSLMFLMRYQEALQQTVEILPTMSDIVCIEFDTSQMSIEDMMSGFVDRGQYD